MIKDSTDPSSLKFSQIKEVQNVRACATSHPCFLAAVPLYKASVENKPKPDLSQPYRSSIRPRSNSIYKFNYKPLTLEKEVYSFSSNDHRLDSNFIQVKPTFMSLSDQIVNFYPVHKKGDNYLKYCIGWLADEDKPRSKIECIYQYTSASNWYCTEVNMALAADSSTLKTYGTYIKQLKYSIGMSSMTFTGTVFRGADMSRDEIHAYETKNIFFIPSFTSTSKSMPFKGKNTLFHIDISPEWSQFCMEILPQHTKYDEDEILFSCYNLYRYIKTEKSNGQRIIKLQLMNYDKYYDYNTNTIFNF